MAFRFGSFTVPDACETAELVGADNVQPVVSQLASLAVDAEVERSTASPLNRTDEIAPGDGPKADADNLDFYATQDPFSNSNPSRSLAGGINFSFNHSPCVKKNAKSFVSPKRTAETTSDVPTLISSAAGNHSSEERPKPPHTNKPFLFGSTADRRSSFSDKSADTPFVWPSTKPFVFGSSLRSGTSSPGNVSAAFSPVAFPSLPVLAKKVDSSPQSALSASASPGRSTSETAQDSPSKESDAGRTTPLSKRPLLETLHDKAGDYFAEGYDLHTKGLHSSALIALNKCINLALPSWVGLEGALTTRAETLVNLQRYVEAQADCQAALKLEPESLQLQVLRGEALLGAGDLTHAEEAFKLAIDCNLNIEYNIDERAITQQQREWTMRAQDGVTNITRYRSSRSDYTVLMTAGLHQDALQCSKYMLALAPCRVARLCTVKAMCALHAFDECKKFIDDFMGSTADTELQPRAHSSAAFPVVASTLVGWCVVNNSFVCDVPATVQYILCMGPELGALYVKFLKNIDMNRSPEHRSIIMAQLYLVLQNLCTKLSARDTHNEWNWAPVQEKNIALFMDLIRRGVDEYENANFAPALTLFQRAVAVDASSHVWNAYAFTRCAMTLIRQGMYQDAIADCNKAVKCNKSCSDGFLYRARASRFITDMCVGVIFDYEKFLSFGSASIHSANVRAEFEDYRAACQTLKNLPQSKMSVAPLSVLPTLFKEETVVIQHPICKHDFAVPWWAARALQSWRPHESHPNISLEEVCFGTCAPSILPLGITPGMMRCVATRVHTCPMQDCQQTSTVLHHWVGVAEPCRNKVSRLCERCAVNIVDVECCEENARCDKPVESALSCGHVTRWHCGVDADPRSTDSLCLLCVAPRWAEYMDRCVSTASTPLPSWTALHDTVLDRVGPALEVLGQRALSAPMHTHVEARVRIARAVLSAMTANPDVPVEQPPSAEFLSPEELRSSAYTWVVCRIDKARVGPPEAFSKTVYTKFGQGVKLEVLTTEALRCLLQEAKNDNASDTVDVCIGVVYSRKAYHTFTPFAATQRERADALRTMQHHRSKGLYDSVMYIPQGQKAAAERKYVISWESGTPVPLMALTIRQKAECKVCFDAFVSAEGLTCAHKCGTFTCWDCLLQCYTMAAKPDAIQGGSNANGELLCSNIECKCPIKVLDLAKGDAPEGVLHAQEDFKIQVLTSKKVSEALTQQAEQFRAEAQRIEQIKDVDEKAAAKLRFKIVDEVLTLRCPRCQTAFVDFEGCFALKCCNKNCQCAFCAWCLKDCGKDAHPHVRACPENNGNGFFGSEQLFRKHHKKRRIHSFRRLLAEANLTASATTKLQDLVRRDLEDLHIRLSDVFSKLSHAPAHAPDAHAVRAPDTDRPPPAVPVEAAGGVAGAAVVEPPAAAAPFQEFEPFVAPVGAGFVLGIHQDVPRRGFAADLKAARAGALPAAPVAARPGFGLVPPPQAAPIASVPAAGAFVAGAAFVLPAPAVQVGGAAIAPAVAPAAAPAPFRGFGPFAAINKTGAAFPAPRDVPQRVPQPAEPAALFRGFGPFVAHGAPAPVPTAHTFGAGSATKIGGVAAPAAVPTMVSGINESGFTFVPGAAARAAVPTMASVGALFSSGTSAFSAPALHAAAPASAAASPHFTWVPGAAADAAGTTATFGSVGTPPQAVFAPAAAASVSPVKNGGIGAVVPPFTFSFNTPPRTAPAPASVPSAAPQTPTFVFGAPTTGAPVRPFTFGAPVAPYTHAAADGANKKLRAANDTASKPVGFGTTFTYADYQFDD